MQPLVEIEESVHVDADPQLVWRLVTDIKRHPEFAGPKSITKVVDFDGPVAEGAGWVAHEKFGPQKFDAPSTITSVVDGHEIEWVSYPPMKEQNRGEGGRVLWGYTVEPERDGTRLTHRMRVLPPAKGAWQLKTMYAVLRLPRRQLAGIRTTLANITMAAEARHPPGSAASRRPGTPAPATEPGSAAGRTPTRSGFRGRLRGVPRHPPRTR
jgi:uncharacterized protein YndB with AHSA1/START domain